MNERNGRILPAACCLNNPAGLPLRTRLALTPTVAGADPATR